MCLEDVGYAFYAVGVVGMIIIAWKLFGKNKKTSQKTDAKHSTDNNTNSISTEKKL